jgi:hypothetical protein
MTTRQFVVKTGDTWEWEETPELLAAVAKLQETVKKTKHDLAELNLKRPHERQTSNS